MTQNLRAYVIMRNDLRSLGAGKAAAHAHHAGTQMSWYIRNHAGNRIQKQFRSWENQAQGAGTCIVLEGDDESMKIAVSRARAAGMPAGVWRDPTFPITTAEGLHVVEMDVCAWFFGEEEALKPILGHFPLMGARWVERG
jgi:peptidyl-tRNA hydrolase